MLRFVSCAVCVWLTAMLAVGLAVRGLVIRGLMPDPATPLVAWLGIASSLIIASALLWALVEGDWRGRR